ncbi:branched-chain-amino-acid aminotransferase 2, chloroplastic-like isoform X2 [Pistacia vera]|uniref:branched-chain-amino-acid aminotransferase 2, chloroplastic-like isoform X2 n=1 Tax=Pistacia vera TaxID=55513 RepID=UPI0012632E4C|nr:branched-chain-amino-acid aminotransferase 2, chloroplastic-like isoform X2 [Pistacia vera]
MIQTSACLRNLLTQSLHPGSSLSKLAAYFCYTCRLASSLQQEHKLSDYSDNEYADLDWDNLGFGITPADYMYITKCSKDKNFEQGKLSRYGNIGLSPSAGVLNYGQGLYEGTKAYRTEEGRILVFRPDQNAMRMKMGAERMCMPSPSIDQFVDAVKQIALVNKRWEGSAPLNLYIEEDFVRATPGGAGGVKTIGNYAPVLKALTRAKNRGFSDVLYLDSVHRKYLEEVSSCNIFIVKGNVISTPATNGTILEGITRKSVIDIAHDHGYQVEERLIPVDELIDADEVFCTGTAVVLAPVGSITYKNRRIEFRTGAGSACQELYSTLVGIQTGLIEDKKGWTIEIPHQIN